MKICFIGEPDLDLTEVGLYFYKPTDPASIGFKLTTKKYHYIYRWSKTRKKFFTLKLNLSDEKNASLRKEEYDKEEI